MDFEHIKKAVIKSKGGRLPDLIVSPDQYALLEKILEIDPNFRPTASVYINLRANELGVKI